VVSNFTEGVEVCCECCVCFQVLVYATSWSLVQRSHTDCGASLCLIYKHREWGGHGPLNGGCRTKHKQMKLSNTVLQWEALVIVFLTSLPRTSQRDSPWHLLTYPWSRVLLEKLTVNFAASQEIPHMYGTRKFLTVPRSARHLNFHGCVILSLEIIPPGDPNGRVVYFRIVLTPEEASLHG
jgi:hypothetical protein